MSRMPDYKEKAREIAARWRGPVGGVLYGDILTALREAHEAGRRAERERCAGIANQYHECEADCGDVIRAAILSEQGDV